MSANAADRPLDPVDLIHHLDSLYRAALRLTRDRAGAEDLVQDTYVRALRYQHSFRPGTNMKAWLFAIMRNLFWDRFHGGRPDPVSLDGDGEQTLYETLADTEAEPEATMLDQVALDEVIQAVESLPVIHREVVLLVDVEELTYKETAEILGVPIGTVSSRLHRARAQLQRVLASYARHSGGV
jgi:RNA polymerase sigma-70 factor (ECF subfamily)